MKQYKIIYTTGALDHNSNLQKVEETLNGMATQGWELFSAIPQTYESSTEGHALVFVRKKQKS